MKIANYIKWLGIINSVKGRLVFYFLVLLIIPLSIFIYIQYTDEKALVREGVVTQLSSVADTRKRSIENWIAERVGDLSLLTGDVLLRERFEKLLSKKYDSPAELMADSDYKDIRSHLQNFIKHIDYSGALLIGPDGRVVVSTLENETGLVVGEEDYFAEAVKAGPDEPYIKDVFLDEVTGLPTMGFSRVFMSASGTGKAMLGVAVLFSDLDDKFYPLVLDWPGKGRTGETLIVTRRGEDIVFLNRLKFVDYEPTDFRIPLSQSWPLPAIYASEGLEGTIEADDYRGVRVIAACRHIPMMNWGLVSKIDETEALEPVFHFRKWTVLFLIVASFLVLVLMLALSKRIVEPISILAVNARKIAKGDFSVVLPGGGKDEIGDLTRSFSEMAYELRVSYEEVARKSRQLEDNNRKLEFLASSLEEKVIERTSEFERLNREQAGILAKLDERSNALEVSREELRKYADELQESKDRASENLEIVERANIELRRIDYMKDQFLGIISHELRTPLSLIMGYASNLLTNPNVELDSSVKEEIEGIYKGADRLKNIISEMLDVSRIDAKGLRLVFEMSDIGELLGEVTGELGPFIRERKQLLEMDDFSGLPKIPMDRQRIYQVFINIIGNAIKFTPDGGRIIIQTRVHRVDQDFEKHAGKVLADHMDIVVRDTGIGLDQAEIDHIFEKFYEVGDIEKHTTSKYRFLGRGVGLGLPIARGIVEAHGGWLWVESKGHDPEKYPGSSFHIMLPLKQAGLVEAAKEPETAEARPEEAAIVAAGEAGPPEMKVTGRPRILIIEDDRDLSELTKLVLKDRYEIIEAANGSDGIRLAREMMPELILLDVYMDGMNGYEVCEVLKSDPVTRNITLAMFTAGAQKWEIDKGYSSGADDYITKPFKPSELVAKIDELISGQIAVRNNTVD